MNAGDIFAFYARRWRLTARLRQALARADAEWRATGEALASLEARTVDRPERPFDLTLSARLDWWTARCDAQLSRETA